MLAGVNILEWIESENTNYNTVQNELLRNKFYIDREDREDGYIFAGRLSVLPSWEQCGPQHPVFPIQLLTGPWSHREFGRFTGKQYLLRWSSMVTEPPRRKHEHGPCLILSGFSFQSWIIHDPRGKAGGSITSCHCLLQRSIKLIVTSMIHCHLRCTETPRIEQLKASVRPKRCLLWSSIDILKPLCQGMPSK